ncbi:hypothetical protein ACFLZZ_03695, partial [Nanoarchaeota archaeon]
GNLFYWHPAPTKVARFGYASGKGMYLDCNSDSNMAHESLGVRVAYEIPKGHKRLQDYLTKARYAIDGRDLEKEKLESERREKEARKEREQLQDPPKGIFRRLFGE